MALDLTGVPFIDAHMHAPLRDRPQDVEGYRGRWYEGDPRDAALTADLTAYRWAIHELAQHLGCGDEEQAVIAATAERPGAAWLRETCARSQVEGVVVDTGYPPPERVLSPHEMRKVSGLRVAELARIEHAAVGLVAGSRSFSDFLKRFDEIIESAAEAGVAGIKSVVAYRSGLAIERVDYAAAEDAYVREAARASGRLMEKALLDFLVVRCLAAARRHSLPFQLHTGYGDREIDLRSANPLDLRPLLESDDARGVRIVLLHGAWPYTREAAWLAAVYPNVYLDVSTCIPPLGWAALVEMWKVTLAVAPISRVHASSDAAGLAEQIGIGAARARASLTVALEELVRIGSLRAAEAEEVAEAVLGGTARQLYFGNDP